jgi:putative transposase
LALLVHIRAVFAEKKGAYGWSRLRRELAARGVHAGKERVRKLMKGNGLQAMGKRKFKATTHSNHALPVWSDLFERKFNALDRTGSGLATSHISRLKRAGCILRS